MPGVVAVLAGERFFGIVTAGGDGGHRTVDRGRIEEGHGVRIVAEAVPKTPYSDLWCALSPLKSVRSYRNGAPLFQSGQPARGIFLVEEGEVRLVLPASAKGEIVFGVAGPGSVLGLCETMTGEAYKLTAETAGPARIACVERGALLDFLHQHDEFCLQIVRLLSEDLHGLYHRFRSMPLPEGRFRKRGSHRVN